VQEKLLAFHLSVRLGEAKGARYGAREMLCKKALDSVVDTLDTVEHVNMLGDSIMPIGLNGSGAG